MATLSTELWLLTGWILFGGSHILLSSAAVRPRLIGALGLGGFKGLYSLVAAATLIFLGATYLNHRHTGAWLFDPPSWSRHVTEGVMLLSILFLVLGFATPNPATTSSEMSGRLASTARGVHRITRHPVNTAFALFGAAHMVSNPTAGDWIFWGGLVVFAIVGSIHQDRRMLSSGPPEFRTFYRETSFVPCAAILLGRQRLVLGEIRWWTAALAVALWIGIRLVHPIVIGGFA